MIRSMTGVGRAEGTLKPFGGPMRVDIRSVNHKYFELSAKLPPQFTGWEREIYEMVRRAVHRGYIQIQITLDEVPSSPQITVDRKLVRDYLRLAQELKGKYHLGGEVNINTLLTLPGVITTKREELNPNQLWRSGKKLIVQAIKELVKMKETEGVNLMRDLRRRINKIRRAVRAIEERVPKRLAERRENLLEQLENLNAPTAPKRILEEVAFISERLDIHEECVRLKSHCSMFLLALRRSAPSGKKLDFIAQEMLRETDTLAAKARDVVISRRAIEIKGEIEKLKEQVRNVE
ncbi:MAG: YicC/YloC family endoribonuclease [candidate division WOR-3 bacterium]